MPMRKAITARNTELDAFGPLLNNGYLRIYSGTQPATPETAASGTLLAELRFNATAFSSSTGGIITANSITNDSSANGTGTAGWFRCLKSDGSTAIYDGECGTSGKELNLSTLSINTGDIVAVTSLQVVLPM